MTADPTAAMASLLGVSPGSLPDRTVALVAMIAFAQSRGITWNQIATTIGCASGKEAKALAKRLAKVANRTLVAQAAERLEAA